MIKLKAMIAIPMIERTNVGVKSPVTGTGAALAVAVGLGVAVSFGVTTGEADGAEVLPDCDAVKAGASPA